MTLLVIPLRVLARMSGGNNSLLAEVSHEEAKMRESLSFLSFLPHRERALLVGNGNGNKF